MASLFKLDRFSAVNLAALFGLLGFLLYTLLGSHADLSADQVLSSLNKREPWAGVSAAHNLTRRDDYSCGKGKPCSNGACCGKSGYCGYGSTYCGTGCTSNCNAKAECGEFASPTGKKCPLNTCCSQYGFCGTTDEFCGTKCQSNCVTHPSPPGGGGGGNVLGKVVGYYESWSQRLSCHKRNPSDLPLNDLTHLNYAFAYIDPGSYKLVTMDTQTPESLFSETTKVKEINPNLKVYISVGGWTFSDNGTATQPVFGKIAASQALRQTFAKNCLTFMNQYGFDGIDIDWEYPGAPDRGGKPEDTANFVSLMQTLRSTFNNSPRQLGITFTAPSSYWYLRWFDIPGLLKYTDWINFMTYDLHGVWDRNNPIGSIVQSHTNLTEIGLALELLWRVNTPPSKVFMGFGFYGRSFQLSNPSCKSPGCQFSGGAAPGPCSKTSGVLEYYEIQAILKQHPDLKPVYDQKAAAKYIIFNNNQWVSYDDKETFQQKVQWANKQGLGGALIWASDTDDDLFNAHSGLLGKAVAKSNIDDSGDIAKNLIGQNGQDCKILPDCVQRDNEQVNRCPNGQSRIGWARGYDEQDCGGDGKYGKRICCPTSTTPKNCVWRGSGSDCNGVCHVGEASLFHSSWGGWEYEDGAGVDRCTRGTKIFCCEAGDWTDVKDGCRWAGCGANCNGDEEEISTKIDGSCGFSGKLQRYCCKKPSKFKNCTWRGTATDCPDNQCLKGEVTVDQAIAGSSGNYCLWGRKKSLCCTVNKEPPKQLQCPKSYCTIDPSLCQLDPEAKRKRSLTGPHDLITRGYHDLIKRDPKKPGDPRQYRILVAGILYNIVMLSFGYNPWPSVYDAPGGDEVLPSTFVIRYGSCDDTMVSKVPFDRRQKPGGSSPNTEHPIDLNVFAQFMRALALGVLTSGRPFNVPVPTLTWLRDFFLNQNYRMPGYVPPVTQNGPIIENPANRVWEAFGSLTNQGNLMGVDRAINMAKMNLFLRKSPVAQGRFNKMVKDSISGLGTIDAWINELRAAIAVFHYLQDPEARARFRATNNLVRQQMYIAEQNAGVGQGGQGLLSAWNQFFPDFLNQVQEFARNFLQDRINQARSLYNGSPTSPNLISILAILNELEGQIATMTFPPLD